MDVVVIGGGQAGLSAAYHLRRKGFVPASQTGSPSFIVLDANARPGGAWQHRWESLRMGTVNGIHELPGSPVPPLDARDASRDVLPRTSPRTKSASTSPCSGPCACVA